MGETVVGIVSLVYSKSTVSGTQSPEVNRQESCTTHIA